MRRVLLLSFVISMSFIANSASAGCEGSMPSSVNQAINPNNPNGALFSVAVRYYSNIERCRRGLQPLAADPNLLQAAMAHSVNMARSNTMSHTTNVRGQRSLRDRMGAFRVSKRVAAENIAQNFLFAFGNRRFVPRGSCQFTYADNGSPVPQFSYSSLAQSQVAGWMASPSHRENLLNRRVTRMEAGIGFAPDNASCGRLYLTQDFAG